MRILLCRSAGPSRLVQIWTWWSSRKSSLSSSISDRLVTSANDSTFCAVVVLPPRVLDDVPQHVPVGGRLAALELDRQRPGGRLEGEVDGALGHLDRHVGVVRSMPTIELWQYWQPWLQRCVSTKACSVGPWKRYCFLRRQRSACAVEVDLGGDEVGALELLVQRLAGLRASFDEGRGTRPGVSSSQSPKSLLISTFSPIMRWLKGTANSGFQRLGLEQPLKVDLAPARQVACAAGVTVLAIGLKHGRLLPRSAVLASAKLQNSATTSPSTSRVDVGDVDDEVLAVGADGERGEVGEGRRRAPDRLVRVERPMEPHGCRGRVARRHSSPAPFFASHGVAMPCGSSRKPSSPGFSMSIRSSATLRRRRRARRRRRRSPGW